MHGKVQRLRANCKSSTIKRYQNLFPNSNCLMAISRSRGLLFKSLTDKKKQKQSFFAPGGYEVPPHQTRSDDGIRRTVFPYGLKIGGKTYSERKTPVTRSKHETAHRCRKSTINRARNTPLYSEIS